MKQRIVIKVQMTCDKCRKNALALAGSTYGVQSVGIEGEEQDQLVVVGNGVDATSLTSCLRKKVKVGRADIVKVEAVVDEEAATKPAAETAASSTDPNPVAGWAAAVVPLPSRLLLSSRTERQPSARTPATATPSKTLAPTRIRGAPSCRPHGSIEYRIGSSI
ncbi:heavy metal-associated isoprenylated plant protein 16-like [Miscanthus floridulus]|uniref:heavy metal-associated isoprenylated plant protein 16-like n=1 Tax=Miscanthus floridulus TaxID=154761 RepID=UPI003459B519